MEHQQSRVVWRSHSVKCRAQAFQSSRLSAVRCAADRIYLMQPGDALFFDATARHGPQELIETPMQYL